MKRFGPSLLALLGILSIGAHSSPGSRLPPIVFVSRAPLPEGGARVPGLGPQDRARTVGGVLLLRTPDGVTRELLPRGAMFDVSDPAVAPDGRRIAFAATPAKDSAWRICSIALDGTSLVALSAPRAGLADDLDPCWIGDRALVFSRADRAQRNTYDGGPVTNLWRQDLDGGAPPRQITFERNGADEPAWDTRASRVLFARWWFNPLRASNEAPGFARVMAHTPAADSINLWQVMSVRPDGTGERLEAGAPGSRRAGMGYQPALARDQRVLAVFANNTGLSPGGGRFGIQSLDRRFRGSERLAGAARDDAVSSYDSPQGLAAPAACSPVVLPDGRVLFSHDPSGRGDFGLWTMQADGSSKQLLLDLEGTLELDAAIVEAWRAKPITTMPTPVAAPGLFRYRNRDVFGGRDAPERSEDARIRFFVASEGVGRDSALLVREVAIPRDGRVDEAGLPAEVPMFEQLVDSRGRVLATPRGPAHVAGFNVAARGAVVECTGCHVGHSTTVRPK